MKQRIGRHYANVVATLALFLVLTGVGAAAAGKVRLVTGKDIKDGSVTARDLARNAVGSKQLRKGSVAKASIKRGAVTSAAIGTNQVRTANIAPNQITGDEIAPGEVGPEEVSLPAPASYKIDGVWDAMVNQHAFEKVVTLGTYNKQAANSALKVDWVGLVKSYEFGCIYQLRVDGIVEGAGMTYAYEHYGLSVSASSLFSELGTGDHQIEVWAKTAWGTAEGVKVKCQVGDPNVGLPQTTVVAEIVN